MGVRPAAKKARRASEKNNMGSKFDPLQYGSGSDGEDDDDDDDDDAVEDATKPAAAPSKPKVRMIEHFNEAQPSQEPAHHTQVDLHASLASRWSGKVEALKKADEERREALEVTQT